MLKFEGKFKVGDIIKAYDFQPMPDRPDSYIIGRIIEDSNKEHGFKAYKVEQLKHVEGGTNELSEIGTEAWIPMEVSFMEYDNRIQLVG